MEVKKNIFISTYVEYYGEQGHMHFLIIHWENGAADAKKYFFEGHTVNIDMVCLGTLKEFTNKINGLLINKGGRC